MPHRYIKTPAGRREALVHDLDLPRSLHNLLMVINDSQPVDYWLSNVRGVGLADVAQLEHLGLIARSLPPEAAAPDPHWQAALDAIAAADELAVCRALKSLAWPMLRGTRAYRFVQDLDACHDPAELRLMARAFLGQVRGELGPAAVAQVRDALAGARPAASAALPLAPRPAAPAPAPFLPDAPPRLNGIVLEAPDIAVAAQAQLPPPPASTVVLAYRLRRWPASRALSAPGFARMASLLSTRALTLAQLASLGRVDEETSRRFLAEMGKLALIEEMPAPQAPAQAALGTPGRQMERGAVIMAPNRPGRAGASAPAAAEAISHGLLDRLRERLGLR